MARDTDGLETTRRIRQGEIPGISKDIPIVALTAHALRGDRDRILAAGMDDYLSKPLGLDALCAAGPDEADGEGLEEPEQSLGDWLARRPHERVWALVDLYREKLPEQLALLEEALAAGDAARVGAAAHALRGSAGHLGTRGMVQLCARLEAFGETGNLEPAAAAFAALAQETRRLEHFLAQARNEGRR